MYCCYGEDSVGDVYWGFPRKNRNCSNYAIHRVKEEIASKSAIARRLGNVLELTIRHILSARVKRRLPASAHNLESVAVELDLLCCAESYVAYR